MKKIIVQSTISILLAGFMLLPATAAALDVIPSGSCAKNNPICGAASGGQGALSDQVRNITNALLFILGVVAVIAIIIGGIMFAVSAGDPGKAKTAKDTVLYAVVGLVVALLAGAIVNFVVTNFG